MNASVAKQPVTEILSTFISGLWISSRAGAKNGVLKQWSDFVIAFHVGYHSDLVFGL